MKTKKKGKKDKKKDLDELKKELEFVSIVFVALGGGGGDGWRGQVWKGRVSGRFVSVRWRDRQVAMVIGSFD